MTVEPGIHRLGYVTCGATAKHSGRPCLKPAGWGTEHLGAGRCKLHGGSSPGGIQQGALELAQQEMTLLLVDMPDIEPHEALLLCVRLAAAEVMYFNYKVASLDEHDLVVRPMYETTAGKDGDVVDIADREELNLWIKARDKATDKLARYSKMALDAGVAERQVQIAERYGETIASLIGGILGRLMLSPEQQALAPQIVSEQLALATRSSA